MNEKVKKHKRTERDRQTVFANFIGYNHSHHTHFRYQHLAGTAKERGSQTRDSIDDTL